MKIRYIALTLIVLFFSVTWGNNLLITSAEAIDSFKDDVNNETADQLDEDEYEEEDMIADPLEPWNRMMFTFNDRLYFWVLKPVARAYSAVFEEDFRIMIRSFFQNLAAPIRIVNNLLQWKPEAAGTELVRFVVNSTAGVFGFSDFAKDELGIKMKDEDLGQTLGAYGLGHGFYIVWPVLGPSSLRDTVGLVGDTFLYPVNYLDDLYTVLAVRSYEYINKTSLHIGDYEEIKKDALDPYFALQDVYVQYRDEKVRK
jgi:phospholipid-binding lipoprotein MlaA